MGGDAGIAATGIDIAGRSVNACGNKAQGEPDSVAEARSWKHVKLFWRGNSGTGTPLISVTRSLIYHQGKERHRGVLSNTVSRAYSYNLQLIHLAFLFTDLVLYEQECPLVIIMHPNVDLVLFLPNAEVHSDNHVEIEPCISRITRTGTTNRAS